MASSPMASSQTRQTPRTLIIIACTVMVLFSGVGIGFAGAQSDPGDPQSFYGSIESEDGTPAPAGTEVFALIGGSVEDSIVINQSGQYGGPDVAADRLDINTGAGDEVVFTVGSPDGPQALESPFDLSEADQTPFELNLTFPDGTFPDASNFEVTIDEDESTLEAAEGEDLTVVADIENTGETAGTQTLTATVDETEVGAEEDVSIGPNMTTTAVFVFTADPGLDGEDVVVTSDDTTAIAPLTVSSDRDPGGGGAGGGGGGAGGGGGGAGGSDDSDTGAMFEVIELEPMEATITQGDLIDVNATITNTGDTEAQQTIVLEIDGSTIDDLSLMLQPDDAETIVFTEVNTGDLDGEHEHGVSTENDSLTGSLNVTTVDDEAGDDDTVDDEAGDDDDTNDTDTDTTGDDADAAEDDIPGFGAVVTLLALLLVSLLFTRRSS